MASRWSTIAIPFKGGIDTKSDPKAAPVASLVELENGVFTRWGSIRKRRGYSEVEARFTETATTDPTFNIEAIENRDGELTLFGDNYIYTEDPAAGEWLRGDNFNRVEVTTESLPTDYANSGDIENYSVVTHRGTRVETYYSSTYGGWRILVYTENGTEPIASDDTSTYANLKPVVVGTKIHVYYGRASNNTLYQLVIDPKDTIDVSLSGGTALLTDLAASLLFDVCTSLDNTYAFVAWHSTDAASTVRYARMTQGGALDRAATTNETGTISKIAVTANDDHLGIAYYNAVDIRFEFIESPNGLFEQTRTISGDTAAYNPAKITGGSSEYRLYFFYEVAGASATFNTVRSYGYVSALSFGAAGPSISQATLAAGAFGYSTYSYVWVRHVSQIGLQNTCFLYDQNARVVATAEYGTAGSTTSSTFLGTANVIDGIAECALLRNQKVLSDYNDVRELKVPRKVLVDLTSKPYSTLEVDKSVLIPGGILWRYDGNEAAENGFLLYPELDITLGGTSHTAVDATGAGSIPNGTYSYKVYYERFDTNGVRIRSAAIPFSVTVSAGPKQIELTIPGLAHTNADDYSIVVYRTKTLGSIYYRVSDWDATNTTGDNKYMAGTTGTVTFIDDLTDDEIAANEIDGFTGGVVDPIAPPACSYLIEAGRRMWVAGGDIPKSRVYFSKLRQAGEEVSFNDSFFVDLPAKGGAVTGVAALNDVAVIFKEQHIYAVAGDGPTNTGLGEFAEPQELTADVGCVDGRTIVETPEGLMFQSDKGIYLLNSSFQVSYVGAPVEAYNNQTITAADLIPDQNLVVFLSNDGTTLAYDYLFQQWTTFTAHKGVSSCLSEGNYVYLSTTGRVLRQSDSVYTDAGAQYRMRLKTAPIRLEDLQQFWRCRRVYVLGEYFSDHELRMNVWFNREGAPQETVTWDVSDFIDTSSWGDQATWGADTAWGGNINGLDYQMSYRLARQKVQSVSFEFVEVPGTEVGRSFELTELALEWAPKQGLGRLEAARRK